MELGSLNGTSSVNFNSQIIHKKKLCWRFRTRFEILLTIIVIVLCAALIVLMVNNTNDVKDKNFNHLKVCLTPGCVKVAFDILNTIDESQPPCDDFYKFACGGWIQNAIIPVEMGKIDRITQSHERLNIQLKDLIENTNESMSAIVTMRNMYKSCMNYSIKTNGLEPLRKILFSLGGWPVVVGPDWDNTTFDWIDVTEKIIKKGFSADMLIKFEVVTDLFDNTEQILFLNVADIGLEGEALLLGSHNPKVKEHHHLMVELAMHLGAVDEDRIKEEMWAILNFEIQLATLERANQSKYLHLEFKTLVDGLKEINTDTTLGYDWIRFANSALQLSFRITETEMIVLKNMLFIRHIDSYISYLDLNDRRLLANYMLWRLAYQSLSEDNKGIAEMKANLHRYVNVATDNTDRWKSCLSKLTGSLSMALSSLYIKNYFNSTQKQRASEVAEYLKTEIKNTILNTGWMDWKTKRTAYKKTKFLKAIIGYPDELLNDALVNNYYKNLNLTEDDFELNIRLIRKWNHKRKTEKLRKVNDPHDWKKFAAASTNVNAFYWQQSNSIVLPAGVLRDMFFDNDRPQYVNFGAIGFIIGHEMIHAFDNIGSLFDERGNIRNWWDEETNDYFIKKSECMIKQYKDYKLPNGLHINGNLTLGENIADNGAIKLSFYAYNKYTQKYGEELQLPALKYTPKQLFWISAAMSWCSKSTPEKFNLSLYSDNHSPTQARVNIALSNFNEFAKSFHCKPGSKMNPNQEDRCTVW